MLNDFKKFIRIPTISFIGAYYLSVAINDFASDFILSKKSNIDQVSMANSQALSLSKTKSYIKFRINQIFPKVWLKTITEICTSNRSLRKLKRVTYEFLPRSGVCTL